jgi:hypothetical protein
MVSLLTEAFLNLGMNAPKKTDSRNDWITQACANDNLANAEDYNCCDCIKKTQASHIIKKDNNTYYAYCDECYENGNYLNNKPDYLEWINRRKCSKRVIPEKIWITKTFEVSYPELSYYKEGDSIEGRICTSCRMHDYNPCITPATIAREGIPICQVCNESWDIQLKYLTGIELKSFEFSIYQMQKSLSYGQKGVTLVETRRVIVELS